MEHDLFTLTVYGNISPETRRIILIDGMENLPYLDWSITTDMLTNTPCITAQASEGGDAEEAD